MYIFGREADLVSTRAAPCARQCLDQDSDAVNASTRIQFGVESLGVQPDDHVLEIGCGHGVALSLIGDSLTTGRVLGIDRSPTMVDMARKRNAALIESGIVDVRLVAFPDDLRDDAGFTIVFAIHVPVFRGDRAAVQNGIDRLLRPGGRLCLIGQPLSDRLVAPWIADTTNSLASIGLAVDPPAISPTHPRTACITGRSAH